MTILLLVFVAVLAFFVDKYFHIRIINKRKIIEKTWMRYVHLLNTIVKSCKANRAVHKINSTAKIIKKKKKKRITKSAIIYNLTQNAHLQQ